MFVWQRGVCVCVYDLQHVERATSGVSAGECARRARHSTAHVAKPLSSVRGRALGGLEAQSGTRRAGRRVANRILMGDLGAASSPGAGTQLTRNTTF